VRFPGCKNAPKQAKLTPLGELTALFQTDPLCIWINESTFKGTRGEERRGLTFTFTFICGEGDYISDHPAL